MRIRGWLRRCLRYAFSFLSLFIARDEGDGCGISSIADGAIVSSESEDSDSALTDGYKSICGITIFGSSGKGGCSDSAGLLGGLVGGLLVALVVLIAWGRLVERVAPAMSMIGM